MRVRTFWTIGNRSAETVQYKVFGPNDTVYAAVLNGLKGELEPGKAVDLEVDFTDAQIVFRGGKPMQRLAEPQAVKTDRPVTLTKDMKVWQPDEAEFTDPAHVEPVVFMTVMEFDNLLRGLVLTGLGKIPEVGGAIAAFVGLLWPEQKRDLIAESEARMKRWVQGRLQQAKRRALRLDLAGLRANLDEYRHALERGELARWIGTVIGACERAMPHILNAEQEEEVSNEVVDPDAENAYTPGTIAIAVAVATLHLSLLRERIVFARKIFGDETVNLDFYQKNFTDTLRTYQEFIVDKAIPGEIAWRLSKIDDQRTIGEQRFLTDWVTREVHRFQHSGRYHLQQGPSQVCVDYYLEQAKGTLARQLHESAYLPSLLWTLLDPARETDQPVALDGVTWNAALAGLGYMYGNEHNFAHDDGATEHFGRITEMTAWVDGRITGLQFKSATKTGKVQGEPRGGQKHVKVPEGAYLTRVETWFDFDLWGIQLHFSDGTKSPQIGTPKRGGVHQFAELPRHHVAAIRVGTRMQELRCGFTPLPNFYDILQA